jgi:hypothetical protein
MVHICVWSTKRVQFLELHNITIQHFLWSCNWSYQLFDALRSDIPPLLHVLYYHTLLCTISEPGNDWPLLETIMTCIHVCVKITTISMWKLNTKRIGTLVPQRKSLGIVGNHLDLELLHYSVWMKSTMIILRTHIHTWMLIDAHQHHNIAHIFQWHVIKPRAW